MKYNDLLKNMTAYLETEIA